MRSFSLDLNDFKFGVSGLPLWDLQVAFADIFVLASL